MITVALARELFRHMQWADAEIWRALLANPAATEDRKLMKIVRHIRGTQRAFLAMWTHTETDPKEAFSHREPDTLREAARAYYVEAEPFLARLDPSTFDEIVVMPWLPHFAEQLGRPLQAPTLGETLVQLPAHSTYHRGQANQRLREVGGQPPLVDYIAWVWFGRPESNWP